MSEDTGGITGVGDVMDAQGNLSEGWRDSLIAMKGEDGNAIFDEATLKDRALDKVKNLGGMLKSYVQAQKAFGADKIVAPTKHSDEEVWNEYYKHGGRPDSPEGYELAVEADSAIPQDHVDKWVQDFHRLGMSTKQARGVVDMLNAHAKTYTAGLEAQAENERAEAMASLKQEWGSAYEENISLFKRLLLAKDPQGVCEKFGMIHEPEFIKLMAGIAKGMSEDTLPRGNVGPSATTLESQIAELRSHPAYGDARHPMHGDIVKRITALYQQKAQLIPA